MKKEYFVPTIEDYNNVLYSVVDFLKKKEYILAVVLFGSYSRGDFSLRHSDIDLYVLMNCDKSFEVERALWREIKKFSDKIQIHLNFDYKDLVREASLLRYNVFKEGKVLFERDKNIFLRTDFDLKEVLYVKLDLGSLMPYQKTNFKRSMLGKYKGSVLDYFGNIIVIDRDFLNDFLMICKNKDIGVSVKYEFMYRFKQDFDDN